MKDCISSLGAGVFRALTASLWLLVAAAAHAQPGPGFALRFNDTNSYVVVPHTAGLNHFPLTVMAWVNTTQGTGQQGLVNKYAANSLNGWNLFLRDGHLRAWYFVNNTRFVWDGSNGLDGGLVADGAWHHVAFTVDASGGKLYIDGVLRNSRAWTGSPGFAQGSQEVRLGNYPGGVLSFNGSFSLDEITVWTAALSQSQVVSNLFTPLTGNEADLLALYRCEEGSGAMVADSAPLNGSNNGTWAGTPRFVPTVVASKPQDEGGPTGNCNDIFGLTEVKLNWRGQNLVGCKVELDASSSRIHRVGSDCTTYYMDLPPNVQHQWTVLSQPAGANAQIEDQGIRAMLTLPRAGDYTVQLTVCQDGTCPVSEPGGASTFLLLESSREITIRAETELPLRVQERPDLPPSATVPTPKLALSDAQRDCMCLGGGGWVDPQWVTVNPWSGANDYTLLEGTVDRSWGSTEDSLLNHDWAIGTGGWYVIQDINVIVAPDRRYLNLLSTNVECGRLVGCEAQGDTIPERFRPVQGDRVSLFGFLILDCGHPPFCTEIHPVVGWAVHRNRPVRIPENVTFTFDLVTNTVTSSAGTNLYVPGIVTDLWFNSDAGGATAGDASSLGQPAQPASPPFSTFCLGGINITQSPIRREYDFNIYLPKNPSQVFAEVGQVRPRAPLHVSISNPNGSPGPNPTFTRMTETYNGVTYEYLRVHLDLRSHTASTYSRRIEAAWVYPRADNWGLQQWRVSLDRLDVYNDLDSKVRWPGSDGDWILWFMLPGADQSWTRVLDGFNNTHGTITFSPPWQTGSSDSAMHRPPLSLDPQRRLGPDILTFTPDVNFWMGGHEADEGSDDGDPGRISSFASNSGTTRTHYSHNLVFSADVTGTRIATLNNGVLSAAATQLGRHYLLTCTNKINNRSPTHDSLNPLDGPGLLVEGISGEPPWSPVDPQQIYGAGAALLGDVNGDGFPDVALGTRSNVQAHLFLGGRNGFAPAPHAIASIPVSSAGAGRSEGPQRTRTLVGAGDANGDGIPDLLIGTPTFGNVQANVGAAYLFSGAQLQAGGSFTRSNILWGVEGNLPGARLGFSLAAGDITHDGISDIVVGAPFATNWPTAGRPLGRVFVYLGAWPRPATTPHQVLIPELDTIGDHWFGHSVSMAGDVNRDGYTDVIIGAPRYASSIPNQGAFYLYYGSSTGLVLNTFLRLEGNSLNAQFGYAVAGAGDVDADGFDDVLVSAPFFSGSELTLENGYVALYRGNPGGLGTSPRWSKFGATGGAHFGLDLGPVGDLNGDGHADIAIAAPDEIGPDGMRGQVSYFLGEPDNALGGVETWRTWGVSGVAKLMINDPCCSFPTGPDCCGRGKTNKVDFNLDGFADALTFDSAGGGDPFTRVQLTLGRGQRVILPTAERYFRAVAAEPYAFQSIFRSNFVADIIRSGQTNEARHSAALAILRNLYLTVQQAGADPGSIVPLLQRLQVTYSALFNLGIMESNLFDQFFADVDLELGTAFYIDCGATNEYTDTLGRQWLPDASFLATTNALLTVFTNGPPITNTLTGDRSLPDTMLKTERWFNGHIRYQVSVPNGWYTVLLYFSENSPLAVSPALGGTGCATCARIFDLEVEGQRLSAYNQADAALPPNGDGLGRLYTATQVPFNVQVTDGLLDIAVLDRGPGNPPENAAIKGIAILGRPAPGKFATRPRIARTTRDGGQFGVLVDPQASLARYLAGEIPVRLQSSLDLTQWTTLPNLPELRTEGAFFSLSVPTNRASFYRAVITPP